MEDSFAIELNEAFVLLHSGFCVLSTSKVESFHSCVADCVQSPVWLYLVTAAILEYLPALCCPQIIFLFCNFPHLSSPPPTTLMRMTGRKMENWLLNTENC